MACTLALSSELPEDSDSAMSVPDASSESVT